jgi:flavin reductase (DIM6/NTAB) family NADH-FMN oxidoreductase RutF
MKTKLGPVQLLYPIPIVLVGAMVNGRPNFETIGQVAIMGVRPAFVCISSSRDHHTNAGIIEHAAFSINMPTTEMLSQVDYCGMVSGRDVDKSALFDVFPSDSLGVPMIRECPLNLECQVIHEFSVEHRQMFIARVVETYVNSGLVQLKAPGNPGEAGGRAVLAPLTDFDPIIYALDNKYYRIGDVIGQGYHEGKKIQGERGPERQHA